MKRKVFAVIALSFLLLGKPAWAHRIDEYLQATILSLDANRADASMRLIPGVLSAPSIIGLIDSNHDGVFSQSETRAYALRVLKELSITVDGQSTNPQLDSYTILEASQLRDGLGEILIQYHVDLPQAASPLTASFWRTIT